MAADSTLRVNLAVLQGCATSLGGAAEHLMSQLAELDDRVGQMLAGWRGESGTTYGSAWELWQQGAREVQVGLSMLAQLMAQAGAGYQDNEAAATRAERAVRGG
ncbi:MAG TPA: WXG100 family type VII secretion target [Mycobacterium sp.]|jgi:WXG100 family type VII secretion target